MNNPSPGTLFIVATPIGNLQDISLRALETLKTVDLIIAEDTRHTGQLLSHFSTQQRMLSFHDHNEYERIPEVLKLLELGQSVALVSDAGTPLVSDPGYKLVRECIARQIPLDSIPGATAAVTALTLSGLPPDKFFFVGFLPEKQAKRQRVFDTVRPFCHSGSILPRHSGEDQNPSSFATDQKADPRFHGEDIRDGEDNKGNDEGVKATIILYESPYKLKKTLEELQTQFGDISVVIARELTKIHQEIFRGSISEALTHFANPKGEFVLLL